MDALQDIEWKVLVSSLPEAMVDACAVAGLSPNAVRFQNIVMTEGRAASDLASLEWPSYFCDKGGFVRVLAYLVQNNLPLDMDVEVNRRYSGHSSFRMHPPLDSHSLNILWQINPREAEAMVELNERAEAIFARLRRVHIPAATGNNAEDL